MGLPFHSLIGLAGVSESESPRAQFWDKIFQWPMLLIALWMPFQFYFDYHNGMASTETAFFDWLVWWFFVIESVLLLLVVNDRVNYLKANWMNVFIIVAGLPIILWGYSPLAVILRSLRLLLMIGLIYRLAKTARKILNKNQLGKTILASFMLILVSGSIIAAIDPAFESPADGIWWALVTISTVGYGDYSPVSLPGRVFASVLIISGTVLLALITANLAAYFVEKEVEKDVEAETLAEEKYLDKTVVRLEKRLIKIEQQLQEILKQEKK